MKPPPPHGIAEFPEHFDPPFHRSLGIRMGLNEAGDGVAWIDVDPERHYGNRWAHGGAVAALVDIASGVTIARNAKSDPMKLIDGTIELKVNYLRKVVVGDMTACARLLHMGKRVAVTDVDVTNDGVLCAKAIATFMLRTDD